MKLRIHCHRFLFVGVLLACWLIACAPSARHITSVKPAPKANTTQVVALKVDGLDAQAQAKITSAMRSLGQVSEIQVNTQTGLVRVVFKGGPKVSDQQVKGAVQKAGYQPKEILKSPLEISQLEKNIPTTH